LIIYRLSTGDCIHRFNKSIVIPFEGKRKVLSTSPLNGGYREDLKAVFNNDANPGEGMECKLRAPTHQEHLRLIASELGLDSDKTAGIDTAASMNNVSIKMEDFEGLSVSAIVTAGVGINGGRVGDPAAYHERKDNFEMLNPGTINIILVIDANLPEGTVTRGLVTCTEAKTAALQELMVGSNYSHGLATGSGTDGTIIVCNSESELLLTNAGKHSKLGELIGNTVKNAVKGALFLEMGLCPEQQHSILKRVKRYKINEEKIWLQYCRLEIAGGILKADFIHRLHEMDHDGELVALTSLYIHVLDQLNWELLTTDEAAEMGKIITQSMAKKMTANFQWWEIDCKAGGNLIAEMVDNFTTLMAAGIRSTCPIIVPISLALIKITTGL